MEVLIEVKSPRDSPIMPFMKKTAISRAGKKGEKKIRAADSDLLAPSICHRSARIVD